MNTKTTYLTGNTTKDNLCEGQIRQGGQRVGKEQGRVKHLEEIRHIEMKKKKKSKDKKYTISTNNSL